MQKEFFEHVRPSSLLKRFATVDGKSQPWRRTWPTSFLQRRTERPCEWMEGDSYEYWDATNSDQDPAQDKHTSREL